MAIYTKTGDKGETSLANGERISKADARIEAYGTVDELNSWIGLLRAILRYNGQWTMDNGQLAIDSQLSWVQNKLFNIGAALSLAPGEWIKEAEVAQLEQWIDAMQAVVPKQKAFILPAGSEAAARCHVCRTICRRAERKMMEIDESEELRAKSEELRAKSEESREFINRLSDYLFVLAKIINFNANVSEIVWQNVCR